MKKRSKKWTPERRARQEATMAAKKKQAQREAIPTSLIPAVASAKPKAQWDDPVVREVVLEVSPGSDFTLYVNAIRLRVRSLT